LSLNPGAEACGDGRTPNFDGPQSKIEQIVEKQEKKEESNAGSNKTKGTQFITGACSVDDDCASTCCSGKKCRAVLSLNSGAEACGDGRTPNFDGPKSKIVQIGDKKEEAQFVKGSCSDELKIG
jgi:hypothetical protein